MANEVKFLNSVTDLASNNNSFSDVVIVKDIQRTSGNPFVWKSSGTANGGTVYAGSSGVWEMQYEGAVNVRWFGALGDDTANDTAAFMSALGVHNSIYVPAGIYRVNLDIEMLYFSITGDGGVDLLENCVLKPSNDGLPVISWRAYANLTDYGLWDYIHITNVVFASDSLEETVGFTFQHERSGRVKFTNCQFTGFDKAIYKNMGNIGMELDTCHFHHNNYGFYAWGRMEPYMHAGNNYFNECNFDNHFKSAVHILDSNNGQGQHTLTNCIFQYNNGFAAFFDIVQTGMPEYSMSSPILFVNTWFEHNGYVSNAPLDPDFNTLSSIEVDIIDRSNPPTSYDSIDTDTLTNPDNYYVSDEAKRNVIAIGNRQQIAIGVPKILDPVAPPSFSATCSPSGSGVMVQCDIDDAFNYPYSLTDKSGANIGSILARNDSMGDNLYIGIIKENGALMLLLEDLVVFSKAIQMQDYGNVAGSTYIRCVNDDNTAYIPLSFMASTYSFTVGNAEFTGNVEAKAHVYKSKSGAPTTGDIPGGTTQVWEDTSAGTLKLWANHNGTLKSISF